MILLQQRQTQAPSIRTVRLKRRGARTGLGWWTLHHDNSSGAGRPAAAGLPTCQVPAGSFRRASVGWSSTVQYLKQMFVLVVIGTGQSLHDLSFRKLAVDKLSSIIGQFCRFRAALPEILFECTECTKTSSAREMRGSKYAVSNS